MAYTIAALEAELPGSEMNELVAEIVASSLKSVGLLSGGASTIAELSLQQPPAPYYERWLSRTILYLQEQDLLADDLRFKREIRTLSVLWNEWEAKVSAWAGNPNQQAQGALLKVCLGGLPSILSGARRATDVMFPNSSMHLVEGLYRGNPQADYFNDVLSRTLSACIDQQLQADPARTIRIVEIGAGTGGTTAALLPVLQRYPVEEYCYTDLSRAFLMHGEKNFKPQLPALTTAIFDVSRPIESQSVAANRYDFAIAANVLHATSDIRETLRNAKAALKSQGILLLNEIAGWTPFNHLTFGLLEGWWLYVDTAVRLPGSPGLSPEKWREILAEEGFESVIFPAIEAHKLGQQIIAAVSDGRTRQRIVKQVAQPAPEVATPRKAHAVEPTGPSEQATADHTRKVITAMLSEALRMDAASIRGDASFADYGVDSIVGVNLVRTISEALQIELETTSLFEYSTVDDLTGYVLKNWREPIAARMPRADRVVETPNAVMAEAPAAAGTRPARFTGATRFGNGRNAFEPAPERGAETFAAGPIAIIGMSGRFAESESLEAFWQHLANGDDLVKPVSRWDAADCSMSATARGYCSHGSFIDSIDRFDPEFFGISAVEAKYMDPQQRLFLEESWRALEDAGYGGKGVHEKQCGVYVGCGSSQYDKLSEGETPAQAFWGNSQSVTPARIAYTLNLQGPAITIDTACSSSLVAIHLACQGLWSRETEMAIAGGVFLQPTPGFYQVANRAGMLSPDGKCYSFDARANGFVPGEGVGVVVLKRLRDAIADGDHIHGVIAASGINQDGKSNGLIAPNGRAQERLERTVYDRFRIDPETIQVVEAHGTGTLLGDSVEYNAITRAFRESTQKTQFCALGTVKTNIGHASTAAGVAGVLKLLLSLKHRQIPPSLHFENGNPAIDLASGPFYVNTQLKPWPVDGDATRRAAISSFGFSGTNAHLVIEEAPAIERELVESPAYLVALSARSAEQVKQQARDLVAHLERTPGVAMTDLSFSLFTGRMHHNHRLVCVARNQDELVRLLGQWIETGTASQVHTAEIQDGNVREQISLRKFGNYCIQELTDAPDAGSYLENLEAIAELYAQGYALEFDALFPKEARRTPLPTYPFARERYWLDGVRAAAPRAIASTPIEVRHSGVPRQAALPVLQLPVLGADLRVSLQNDLSNMVRELLNLGTTRLAQDKVLMDLGFDSIGLTNFAHAINERYRLDITPVLFFDYPSIGEIARYLAEERGSEISVSAATPAVSAMPQPVALQLVANDAQVESQPVANVTRSETQPFSPELRFVNEPIAIVGIAGVMPQSEDLDALWANLKDGKDLVTVIPEDRWDWQEYFGDPLKEVNKSNSKWGGFMKEIDKFDPLFFGISPREAQMMDPQQRIFLETVWKAVEDSGQKVSELAGTKTGLFVGVGSNDYLDLMRNQTVALDGYTASGNAHSVLANRVSFLLNLRGPSSPIDTACSSSLVVLHRAIESIHTRSCEMAIVGGVQVIMSPGGYISFGMAGMLSGDGKCKTFDKSANGYVRGEGCGAMLLKPLSRAEADGNHIYAVIRATSENHGGRVTTMVAPNSAAQASLLVEAYEKGQIDPATVSYIECHGTGTSLGDPIEVQALSKAFSELYAKRGKTLAGAPHCGLGTIKTNIGHLETAAGIAGLLKVLLAMKHKQLPGTVHFEELNPYIKLEGTPFYVVDKLTPWEAIQGEDGSALPRRAGVSSFGFGGANAHAVLEEYVPAKRDVVASEPQLIVLSAKNEDRLLAYVRSTRAYLDTHEVELLDLAYTLQVGRDEMPARLAVVAASTEELKRKLDAVLAGQQPDACVRGDATNACVDESPVRAAIERKDLSGLGELWVAGARIDWRLLHKAGTARRVSAPTYPFARERYWLPGEPKNVTAREQAKTSLQTFAATWSPARIAPVVVPESSNVLLLGDDREQLKWVRESYPQADLAAVDTLGDRKFDQLLWMAPESDQQEHGVLAVFRTIKTLLQLGYGSRSLQWTIVTTRTQQVFEGEAIHPAHAAIAGLIGSLAKEYPHWSLRLLDVESLEWVTARECLSLPWDKQGNGLAYRRGEWFQQALTPAAVGPHSQSAYRRNGVYVVIGGAGGIGEVWSRFMIEHYQARVVWIGRRPYDSAIEEKVNALTALGSAPLYIAADATDASALAQAREKILRTFPAIHGVVHSALVLNDQSIAMMDEAAFRSSLSAKVDITANLDGVFGSDALDFMLFFSSIVSFVRPAGQSNYAAGCAFKDSFAAMLQERRPYPVKTMNWGYWGSVGVAADDVHRQNMARVGLASIEPEEGMAALETLMSSGMRQVALIKTVSKDVATAAARQVSAAPETADDVRRIIVERLCEELRLEPSVIRNDAPMSDFGVDSIVGVNLVRGLSEALQIPLEPSSLFDYGTVDQLTAYIVATWPLQGAVVEAVVVEAPRVAMATPTVPEPSVDALLDELLCEEAALAGSYEKVTF